MWSDNFSPKYKQKWLLFFTEMWILLQKEAPIKVRTATLKKITKSMSCVSCIVSVTHPHRWLLPGMLAPFSHSLLVPVPWTIYILSMDAYDFWKLEYFYFCTFLFFHTSLHVTLYYTLLKGTLSDKFYLRVQ